MAFFSALIALLLLVFIASGGSAASQKDESDKAMPSADAFSIMAPNEGDIPNWAPESEPTNIPEENNSPAKEQPGFDFLMALLLAALSAVQIKKRSQAIKKK